MAAPSGTPAQPVMAGNVCHRIGDAPRCRATGTGIGVLQDQPRDVVGAHEAVENQQGEHLEAVTGADDLLTLPWQRPSGAVSMLLPEHVVSR